MTLEEWACAAHDHLFNTYIHIIHIIHTIHILRIHAEDACIETPEHTDLEGRT